MTERFLCIHAHFYQPPRENPWLEAVEVQDSAYPYHDWNERVTAECYGPNAESRILDGDGRIIDIVNNYRNISFNFGPTLLAWLETKAPDVYTAIQTADSESKQQFSGHGSAISQAYNHMILPLANARDKSTQIIWGIRDFEYRFGRKPEGMWLPEAAVDVGSLEALASRGIAFTILSPHSAQSVRKIGTQQWQDVSGGRIDPSMPYKIILPSGREIAIFFYDGPISRAVAFENLLEKGENFANRLLGAFSDIRTWPQLAHIATDGETYGHHRPHAEMALAYAIRYIESQQLARLTNYGEFLEKVPPTHEARIFENSSWSCAHGVERWRSDCGCNSGMHGGWNQSWRAPLRAAFDWLRDALIPLFEKQGAKFFKDPWQVRDEYIDVILNRSTTEDFLKSHARTALCPEQATQALKLLEIERHAMLMYTSCGWFFDELSGMETVQSIEYAARAVQLAESLAPASKLECQFAQKLENAKSNLPQFGDGKRVYEEIVKPATLDLLKAGAHYAISTLFHDNGRQTDTYCYAISQEHVHRLSSGKTKLLLGHAEVKSKITWESLDVSFGVIHMGDQNIAGGVREFAGSEPYSQTRQKISDAFERGDFADLVRLVDKEYGTAGTYTLRLLFRDEQRRIMDIILNSALEEADQAYRQLYENRAPLMRFVAGLGMPPIPRLQVAAEFTLNSEIRHALESHHLNVEHLRDLVGEAQRVGVALDRTTLEFVLRKRAEDIAARFRAEPFDMPLLQLLAAVVDVANSGSFGVWLWKVQNIYFDALKRVYPKARSGEAQLNGNRDEWLQMFRSLGDKLLVRVD